MRTSAHWPHPATQRARSGLAIWFALMVCLTTVGSAQNVQLRLHEPDGRTAVIGAIVTLLDPNGLQAARGLTNEVGVVALAASPGRYRAQVDRIGHSRFLSAAFAVTGGPVVQVIRLSVAPSWTVLPELATSGVTTCQPRGELSATAATLWEEARKALTAGVMARGTQGLTFQQVQYVRQLAPTLAVTSERRDTMRTRTLRPFVALAADRLVADGYILQDQHGSYQFYAPDEAILLSDGFLDTHCLIAQRDEGPYPGLVGLRFEPAPERTLPDVAGTIWLDAASFELRFVEFRFVNLPAELGEARGTGRVDFTRHPSGIWYVSRWFIRAPVVGRQPFLDGRRVERFRIIVMGYTEYGGEAVPLLPVGLRAGERVVATAVGTRASGS